MTEESIATVSLPSHLDLGAAQALHTTLVGVSDKESKVYIDGSAVERATTPCIQLLLAAGRSAEAHGQIVEFRLSDHLREVVDELGLGSIFDLWELAND